MKPTIGAPKKPEGPHIPVPVEPTDDPDGFPY